jgi:Flp pilus assembly pilin Flp
MLLSSRPVTQFAPRSSLRSRLAQLFADTRGASFIEYVIVVGLVAIIAIAAFQKFGETVVKKLEDETKALDKVKPAGGG